MLKCQFDTEELASLYNALSRDLDGIYKGNDIENVMACFSAAIDELCEMTYSRVLELTSEKQEFISDCWHKVFGEDKAPEKVWEYWDT